MCRRNSEFLRVHLKKGMAKLKEDCDILIDQVRAIDNKRLQVRLGILPADIEDQVKHNLSVIIDL
ncbi:MAG: type II toxin-antitoxin system PemK/MazF family toxin [Segetibacter sp.]